MENFIIKKILNNNVVIATKQNQDYILIGKGLGFENKKGSIIKESSIEHIFIEQSKQNKETFTKLLDTVDDKIVGLTEELILNFEKELGLKFNESIHISLPDHISFAIKRIQEGMQIENPFLSNIKILYPKEYELASKAVTLVNHEFNANLPHDEIGFICLHLNAALTKKTVSNSLKYTKKLSEIMDFISKLIKKDLDKNSIQYIRTLSHIKFMLERLLSGKTIKNYLLDYIKKELYNEYDKALTLALKIENLFSISVPEDEVAYIALHLKRLTDYK